MRTSKPLRENIAEGEAFVQAFAAARGHWTPVEIEAVEAVFFQGRSVRAAAEHLGAPLGTVADRIKSARATLRLWLRREHRETVSGLQRVGLTDDGAPA